MNKQGSAVESRGSATQATGDVVWHSPTSAPPLRSTSGCCCRLPPATHRTLSAGPRMVRPSGECWKAVACRWSKITSSGMPSTCAPGTQWGGCA